MVKISDNSPEKNPRSPQKTPTAITRTACDGEASPGKNDPNQASKQ